MVNFYLGKPSKLLFELILTCSNEPVSCCFLIYIFFSYKLDDGTGEEKMGRLMPNDKGPEAVLVQRGSYTTNVDGQLITYNWIADTRGFRISKA